MMMDYMQSFLVVTIEVACFYLFQDIFMKEYDLKRRGSVWVWITVLSLLSCGGSHLLKNIFILKEVFMILILFSGLMILKPRHSKKNFLITVLFVFLLVIADLITIVIDTRILTVDTSNEKLLDMLVVLMSKAILLLLIMIAKRIAGEKWGYATDEVGEFWYVLFPFISICVIAAIMANGYGIKEGEGSYFVWTIIFLLIAMNILLVFYIKNNAEKNTLLQEKRMFEMDAKGQQILYRSLEKKIEMQRTITHDYKNHLSYIAGLLEHKEYDMIEEYLEKINGKLEHDLDRIDTNNPIINTVINTKYNEAKNTGAVVVCKINDLSGVQMEETDMIVLLSNAFNNAIEAVSKCQSAKILRFKIVHENGEFVISLQNTYNGVLRKDGELYQTTKDYEKGYHGIGIRNMIRIVNKYHGMYRFHASNQVFKMVIIIPMEGSSC